jgi:acyl-CoA synthetase (AMP-forming)/AMP-acid ligase II
MKCLINRLQILADDRILWISGSTGAVVKSDLDSALTQIDPSPWYRKRVAIGKLSAIELVVTLIFLDGLAASITLLPDENIDNSQEIQSRKLNIDFIIENDGLGISKLLLHQAKGLSSSRKFFVRPFLIKTSWLLSTSGTTGTPKIIEHTFNSLTRSIKIRDEASDLIWGSLYSIRRFAGLQVFFQSLLSGATLILNDESNLNSILQNLIRFGCSALSATPSMWRKLIMHPLCDDLNLRQITLGGEIVDQSILNILSHRFPKAQITHIYASTEVGVAFAVKDVLAGFPAIYLLQPPAGVEVRIDHENHLFFKIQLNKFMATTSSSGWIDSGDIAILKDGRVNFMGRANGSINVGGNKVMPEEVEAVIKELPDVAFVLVRGRKSAILGNLVEAIIMPMPSIIFDDAFKVKVIDYCRNRLDGYKVPAFILYADDFHLTTSGKLSRSNIK